MSLVWCETGVPDLAFAKQFAEALKKEHPEQLLAYNCSPSFNWKKHLSDEEIASFQQEISKMGYKFQFITLAGFHTQNIAIFELAEKYKKESSFKKRTIRKTEEVFTRIKNSKAN